MSEPSDITKGNAPSTLKIGLIGRRILTLAGGTASAQVITACATPLVTRLYTPDDMGIISVFLSFFGFWSVTLSLRYESAILIAPSEPEYRQLFRLGLLLVLWMSLLGMPLLYVLRRLQLLGLDLLPSWSPALSSLIFLGFGSFMMCRALGLRLGDVSGISKATVARSFANSIARVSFSFAGGGVGGLFIAELVAWWSAMLVLRGRVKHALSLSSVDLSWKSLFLVMRRYKDFAKFELPSVALNKLALVLPVPMSASLYGATAAGWFGLAMLLVAMPNSQIGAAVADVLQMELGKAVREGKMHVARHIFYMLLSRLALAGLVPLTLVMSLSVWLTPIVFGAQWAQMGWVMVTIAPWIYAAFVISSLSRVLSVFQEQKLKLVYDVASLAAVLGVYVIAKSAELGFIQMLMLLTVSNMITYGLYLSILIKVIERNTSVSESGIEK